MATPHSQAVRFAKSGEADFDALTPAEAKKAEHYGYLGQIIDQGVEGFLGYAGAVDVVRSSHHVDSILPRMQSYILEMVVKTIQTQDFEGLVGHIEGLHQARLPNASIYGNLESHITSGVNTFVNIIQGVYDGLELAFGSGSVAHPKNAAILDRIAKLHLKQLLPYIETYLRPWVYQRSPYNLIAFREQFEIGASGEIVYKKGFPLAAPISSRRVGAEGAEQHHHYRFLDSTETKRLQDFPLDEGPTIGCPITFSPEHIRALWEIYATTRHGIESLDALASLALANSPLDTEEPSE